MNLLKIIPAFFSNILLVLNKKTSFIKLYIPVISANTKHIDFFLNKK